MLAALAGLVFASRLNTATPKAGLGFELDVIAAYVGRESQVSVQHAVAAAVVTG